MVFLNSPGITHLKVSGGFSSAPSMADHTVFSIESADSKGQIKPKTDWRAVDSPKKRTNEFVLFALKSKKAKKTNLFFHFLGESMARKSAFGFI